MSDILIQIPKGGLNEVKSKPLFAEEDGHDDYEMIRTFIRIGKDKLTLIFDNEEDEQDFVTRLQNQINKREQK